MKDRHSNAKKVEALLLANPDRFITSADVRAVHEMSKDIFHGAIITLRRLHGNKLIRAEAGIGKFVGYKLVLDETKLPQASKVPKRSKCLPKDLWRGWRNPVTGYQPAKLGV